MAAKKDYFGLPRIISIILAIIAGPICGALTRFQEGKLLAALIRLIFGFNIVYILDAVLMVLNGRILRIL